MTPVGPATEAGAPVVSAALRWDLRSRVGRWAAPKNAAERLERLLRLADEAADRAREELRETSGVGVAVQADAFLTTLSRHARERLAQAAQAWELEVAEAREESREMLAIAHDRIAQLEQTVERLGRDLAAERVACVEFDDRSAMQRRTIAALIEQLAAEMQRGGGA